MPQRTDATVVFSDEPRHRTGIGVVASFDFNQDHELWQWVPGDVTLFIARTDPVRDDDPVGLVSTLNEPLRLDRPTREVCAVGAEVVVFSCTACSFVGGIDAEAALRQAMLDGGASVALTTSGAGAQALRTLGATSVAVVHPYLPEVGARLRDFLTDSGLRVVAEHGVPRSVRQLSALSDRQVADLILAGDHADAEAIFVSCTATPTYDVIAPLERKLGKPIVTANQATVWAALRAVDGVPVGPGQSLVEAG